MPDEIRLPFETILRFGPFVLKPAARRLEKDGIPVSIGGRALDMLILLADRPGEIIGHQALQDRVWQNINVEPSSLRVQMATLRKALGEGEGGGQYVATIPGRGYCFVAPVLRETPALHNAAPGRETGLPKPNPLVGRDRLVSMVIARLVEKRFVTITGPGGIGKTALAVAVAHSLVPAFNGAVHFLDFSAVASPQTALAAIARAALGATVHLCGRLDWTVQYLRGRRVLLVLDCCDAMIEAMTEFAASVIKETETVHVLVTSRRIAAADAPDIVRLPALAYPDDAALAATRPLPAYPAIQLLTDLIKRRNDLFQPDPAELRMMGRIAARLDGLPLALELAAASIVQNGLEQTESLAESRFALFMTWPNAQPPRHESLDATLEWSYQQLTPEQRAVFRYLSVFVGPFTLHAAQIVAATVQTAPGGVAAATEALLAHSLIYLAADTGTRQFCMLDTTRGFAAGKRLAAGEEEIARRRHAHYIEEFLLDAQAGAPGLNNRIASGGISANIRDIRAALEWCFTPRGDHVLGARIAAASSPGFEALWLEPEALKWLTLALSRLEQDCNTADLELALRLGIVSSGLRTNEHFQLILTHLPRIAELAENCGSDIKRLEALAWDCMLMAQLRPIDATLARAARLRAIALSTGEVPARLLGDWLLGFAYHLRGELHRVAKLCVSATTLALSREHVHVNYCQKLAQVCALGSHARTLWLQGAVDTALAAARAAVAQHGTSLARRQNVPVFLIPLFMWAGAWEDAEQLLARLAEHMNPDGEQTMFSWLTGAAYLRKGDITAAIPVLQQAFDKFPPYGDPASIALDLAEALALAGRFTAARQAMDRAFACAQKLGETFFTPELYRVMGVVMTLAPIPPASTPAAPMPQAPDAEAWLLRAIDCAARQGSLSLELRAATSLARHYTAAGRTAEAHTVLRSVYGRFREGFTSPDLIAARSLLSALNAAPHAQPGCAAKS